MISFAGAALVCILAFALLYYSKIMFAHWFRQGYQQKAQKTALILPMPSLLSALASPDLSATKQKGYAFEQFVVTKFPREHFRIKNWRSDKYVDGIYASSNKDPDLMIEYSDYLGTMLFAVECKWRAGFKNKYIEWAKDYQIRNYYDFQKGENAHVFIIIGVGGTEDCPQELFIIPLNDIHRNQTSLDAEFMKPYRRADVQKMFFLNTRRLIIK
jgi:hypothetical protein